MTSDDRNSTTEDDAVLDFLDAFLDDRGSGTPRTLREYLERFPEAELAVAREYLRLRAEASSGGAPARVPTQHHFGPFRLVEELGRGGQGVVWRAVDTRLGREVALKVLAVLGSISDEGRRRFLREARLASRFEHPGICAVHEVGEEDGVPWIAMQRVSGHSLAEEIDAARGVATGSGGAPEAASPPGERHLPGIDRVLDLVEEVARSVHAAHEAGIVHRDLKPRNIMVTAEGRPIVLDFGCAGDTTQEDSLTRSGDLLGTPAYMAPEQLRGGASRTDRRSDVYALGITLFEALTLERPFRGATQDQLVHAILETSLPNPRRLRPGIGRDLAIVLSTATEKDPARRYQTALDFANDLRAVRTGATIAARPTPALVRGFRFVRRNPGKALAFLAALSLAAALPWFLRLRDDAATAREAERAAWIERRLEDSIQGIAPGAADRIVVEDILRVDPGNPEAIALLAMAEYVSGGPAPTLSFLDERPGIMAANPELERLRAHCLENAGRVEDAAAIRSRLGPPRTAFAYFLQGLCAETSFKADKTPAVKAYAKAVLHGDRIRRYYVIRWGLALQGHSDKTMRVEVAELLLDRWPDHGLASFVAGTLLQSIDRKASADAIARAVDLAPDNVEARIALAMRRAAGGDKEAAEAEFRRLVDEHPGNSQTMRRLFAFLVRNGRVDEAAATLLAFAERSAEALNESLLLADDFLRLFPQRLATHPGYLDTILELVERHEQRSSPMPVTRALRILVAARRGDHHAVEDLAARLDNPESQIPNHAARIGRILVEASLFAAGRRWLGSAFDRLPDLAPVFAHPASQALLAEGRAAEAEALCRVGIEAGYEESLGLILGRALMQQGKHHEALAHWEDLLANRDPSPAVHCERALTFEALKRVEDAVRALASTVQKSPDHTISRFHLGRLLLHSGKAREAIPHLRRAHQEGSRGGRWDFPSADLLKQAEAAVEGQ